MIAEANFTGRGVFCLPFLRFQNNSVGAFRRMDMVTGSALGLEGFRLIQFLMNGSSLHHPVQQRQEQQ